MKRTISAFWRGQVGAAFVCLGGTIISDYATPEAMYKLADVFLPEPLSLGILLA